MLKLKKNTQVIDEIVGFVCDSCGKAYESSDWIEMQECAHIYINGGYGSVFGDGAELKTDLCQECAKKILGPFLKEKPEEYEEELPYIESYDVVTNVLYNPAYGDDKICECGHSYVRHFDPYENMEAVGCKYCQCYEFKENVK